LKACSDSARLLIVLPADLQIHLFKTAGNLSMFLPSRISVAKAIPDPGAKDIPLRPAIQFRRIPDFG